MFTNHVIKQLSAYCNGELSSEQTSDVRKHLLACERCRKEYDEIKLGVQLAAKLPATTAPSDMWSGIEALLDEQSRKPLLQPRAPRLAWAFSWYSLAAVSAVLVVAAAIGIRWASYDSSRDSSRPSLAVNNLDGAARINGRGIKDAGTLRTGGTLETDSKSRARVKIDGIGEVDLDPNSKIRLVTTGPEEHRLALDRGQMHARIKAPPRLFFVDTPSAEAIDLGCAYSLSVDDQGRGFLHVTSGWVELAAKGHESYVPVGAICEARPALGPGTPYFDDASEALVTALEQFDFEDGGDQAFSAVLANCRQRDTFTLWQLLSRVEGKRRVQVLDRMVELVGLPAGITRDGTLNLDQATLEAWKVAMDLVWF